MAYSWMDRWKMVMELLEDYGCDDGDGTVTKYAIARVLIFSNINVVELYSSQTCLIGDNGVRILSLLSSSKKLESC